MTKEEMDIIVNKVIEKTLLEFPKVIMNIMQVTKESKELSEKFFSNNPHLQAHKLLVAQVIEEVEKTNFGKSYKELLDIALPIINQRIHQVKGMSSIPAINKAHIDISKKIDHYNPNGEL